MATVIWLRRIQFLIKKEILAILKDPANRAILIMPALIQAILFGYAANFDVNHVDYVVLDQSHSRSSTELMTRLDGTGKFNRIATLTSSSQMDEWITSGKALMAITIPSDFENKLNNHEAVAIQVVLDGINSSTATTASSYVSTLVASFNQTQSGIRPPISIEERVWYNPNLESRWGIMPNLISALSLIQTLMLSALSVAREREQNTFDQLLVTPLTPTQLLLGKALPSIVIGLIQSTIIFLIILLWFKIPFNGSLGLLYFGLLIFNISAVGIGLSISAVSLNMQQAMMYVFLIMMPLVLLSGLVTPIQSMPEALNILTHVNPLRFAMDLVRRVYLEDASFSDVAFNFIPMIVLALITLPLATWLFRNRLY